MSTQYWSIEKPEFADDLIWVTERADQGQIVEVSYADRLGAQGGHGSTYRRIVDHSDGLTQYAKLA